MTDYTEIESWTLSALAQAVTNPTEPSGQKIAKAEITRRTAKAQIDAARYMKWSVVAIAITSGLTAFASLANWLLPNPLGH